jgi:hypothetical protein
MVHKRPLRAVFGVKVHRGGAFAIIASLRVPCIGSFWIAVILVKRNVAAFYTNATHVINNFQFSSVQERSSSSSSSSCCVLNCVLVDFDPAFQVDQLEVLSTGLTTGLTAD